MRLLVLFIPLTAFALLCVTVSASYTGDADPSVVHEEHIIRKRHPYYRVARDLPRAWLRPYVRPVVHPYTGRPLIPPALRPPLRLVGH
ncbi:hypothetical protein M514_09131 [Trichuris suis]|uniref:Uncharacterized protein n=1 Tax=Trichuris suis TaxID=68888 RepID=A0A085N5M3_9BILA|nr:hypothetical protein M513_09131 [Trichuris suis]KFD64769.1 hypothetical protein M514_09131 [Trichuris suis]